MHIQYNTTICEFIYWWTRNRRQSANSENCMLLLSSLFFIVLSFLYFVSFNIYNVVSCLLAKMNAISKFSQLNTRLIDKFYRIFPPKIGYVVHARRANIVSQWTYTYDTITTATTKNGGNWLFIPVFKLLSLALSQPFCHSRFLAIVIIMIINGTLCAFSKALFNVCPQYVYAHCTIHADNIRGNILVYSMCVFVL